LKYGKHLRAVFFQKFTDTSKSYTFRIAYTFVSSKHVVYHVSVFLFDIPEYRPLPVRVVTSIVGSQTNGPSTDYGEVCSPTTAQLKSSSAILVYRENCEHQGEAEN